jgi:hypothetical protein
VTDQPIKIETSTNPPPTKTGRGYLFWLAVLAVLCYLGSIFVLFPAFVSKKLNPKVQQNDPAAVLQVPADEAPADESQLQWTSPTSGPPITLEYVPMGTQVISHLRPAKLVAHSEGERIIAALGPWGEYAAAQIEKFTGSKLSEIDSLLIALVRVEEHWDYVLRASFSQPRKKLPTDVVGRRTFQPAAGQGRVLISCPTSLAAELQEQGGIPALLARDLERLLSFTDQDRTATLLMPTKFLDTEGRELFADGNDEQLLTAFESLVPSNASAVLVSCNWHENFFCELAATIVQNAPAHRFNAKFAAHLADAEKHLVEDLTANPPPEYGKAIEDRFPEMLGMMSDFTRVSEKNGIALARCYLPVQAGHNLLLASRLRLGANGQTTQISEASLSLPERLRQVTTLSFPKETLENALEMLASDAKLPIQIAGRDLQLEGITKNQTFALDLRNRPVAEILVEILRRANPDRETTGPEDPRQKLVYVIRDGVVMVTTRSAAAQRNDLLPEVFRDSAR